MRREPPAIALIGRAIDVAIVIGGMVLAALIFGNILSRYLLDFDVAWSTELAVFLLVWTTFLGAAAASRRRAHLQVVEFVDMIEARTRRLIEVAIQLVVAVVLVLLVW